MTYSGIARKILLSLDVATMERVDSSSFRLLGDPPEWFREICPGAILGRVWPVEQFSFLEDFLINAESFWQNGSEGRLKSGAWTDVDSAGREIHLEASAMCLDGRKILIIEPLRFEFDQIQMLAQRAREKSLDYERLVRAETALRKSETKTRALLDAIPDLMFQVNSDGLIIDYRSREGFGLDTEAEELLNSQVRDIGPRGLGELIEGSTQFVLSTGTAQTFDFEVLDSIKRDFEVRTVAAGEDEALVIIRDITRRKQLQRDLIDAREAAQDANKAKSEFLARMSHELRTPLNGIIGFVQFLLKTELDEDQLKFANRIEFSAESLLTIINDLLDISRIEARKLTIEVADFDLSEVLDSSVELVGARIGKKPVQLRKSIDSRIPAIVEGDKTRLRQVLINLLGNALKFTDKGAVTIRVELDEETSKSIRFEVIDTGIGISEEGIERLFKPFSQAESSTFSRYGGTGLGLAISKQLVELMGGTIGVESNAGKGSRFWFTLHC